MNNLIKILGLPAKIMCLACRSPMDTEDYDRNIIDFNPKPGVLNLNINCHNCGITNKYMVAVDYKLVERPELT